MSLAETKKSNDAYLTIFDLSSCQQKAHFRVKKFGGPKNKISSHDKLVCKWCQFFVFVYSNGCLSTFNLNLPKTHFANLIFQ